MGQKKLLRFTLIELFIGNSLPCLKLSMRLLFSYKQNITTKCLNWTPNDLHVHESMCILHSSTLCGLTHEENYHWPYKYQWEKFCCTNISSHKNLVFRLFSCFSCSSAKHQNNHAILCYILFASCLCPFSHSHVKLCWSTLFFLLVGNNDENQVKLHASKKVFICSCNN